MLPFRALKRLERGALKKPNKALLEDLMLLMPLSIPLTLLCPKIDRLKVALNLNLMLKWSIMLLPHPETRNMLLCKSLLRKHLGIGLLLMFLRQVLMLHRVLAQVHRPLTLRLPLSLLKLNAKKRLLIIRSGSKRRILVVNPLLSLEMRLPLVLLSLSPTKKCLERLFLLACCPLTFLCRVFLLLRIPRRLKQGPDSALRHLLLPPGLATRLLLMLRPELVRRLLPFRGKLVIMFLMMRAYFVPSMGSMSSIFPMSFAFWMKTKGKSFPAFRSSFLNPSLRILDKRNLAEDLGLVWLLMACTIAIPNGPLATTASSVV